MTKIIEVEFETTAAHTSTALARFFKKYPELNYWADTFEYMASNNEDFFSDITMADGIRNNEWVYALHLNINPHIKDNKKDFYMCIIERA